MGAALAAAAPAVAQEPAPAEARAELRRSLGPHAVVTPGFIAGLDGALTAPSSRDPVDVAARYVRRHRAALGLTRDGLGSLRRRRSLPLPRGAEQVRWRQFHDGVPVVGGDLAVTLGERGEIFSVSGSPAPEPRARGPRLAAAEALVAAGADAARALSGPSGPARSVRFAGGARASLAIFRGRLAWQVVYADGRDVRAVVVDAGDGTELDRSNLVRRFSAQVFELHPDPLAEARVVDLTPWLDDGATTLSGPAAHVWTDVDGDDALTADEEIAIAPGGLGPAFDPVESGRGCEDAAWWCAWDSGDVATRDANREAGAIQAFYYVNRFRDWLAGKVPVGHLQGSHPVEVQTVNGAAVNNASMTTPPPGTGPATMELHLFSAQDDPRFRDVNAADDALTVAHEYAHAYTDLTVGHDGDMYGLRGPQGDAMAEGFSDYYALDHAEATGLVVDGAPHAELQLGEYLDAVPRSSRFQALDCPVASPAPACGAAGGGGFTLGDFGRIDEQGREPHADGEVWAQTLWDLRGRIGGDAVRGILAAALPQVPTPPSFLDMRNALLTADALSYGGAHGAAIWAAFAARGMGCGASFPVSAFAAVEDFRLPAACRPAGAIAVGNARPLVGQAVVFDAGAIAGGNVASQSWRWDFGDGRVAGPSGESRILHAFATPGVKTVHVTVTNAWGAHTASAAVEVVAPPEPEPPVLDDPGATIPRSGTRARIRVRVTCDAACSGTVRLKVARRLARRLGVGRTVGSRRVRLTAAGTQRVTVKLARKVVRRMRRERMRTLKVRASASLRDSGGRRGGAGRTVRIRR